MKKYHGSCSCGKVRFEAEVDLSQGTFKCNCTVCGKGRYWGVFVKLGGVKVTAGEEAVKFWGEKRKHHFCSLCGTKLFGYSDTRGTVNLAALDDIEKADLAKATIKYVDGLHDNFSAEPAFKELL